MLRTFRHLITWNQEQQANGLAASIAFSALALLYFEAPPIPAGSESLRLQSVKSRAIQLQPVVASMIPGAPQANLAAEAPAAVAGEQSADAVLQRKVALLEAGLKFLDKTPDYTAMFSKQELVGDELLEPQDIYLKCRHAPFSIYLRWLSGDEGREVLYTDGANEGKMIVHGGGWKARLPALTISPDSSLAMQESRYPVTKAGLRGTLETMLDVHRDDLAQQRLAKCEQLEDQEFDGRMCSAFLIEYKDAGLSPTYRKSITLIDKQWSVPVYTRNFGWPFEGEELAGEELDEATLIEFYTFTDVQFQQELASADFDRANEEYRFR